MTVTRVELEDRILAHLPGGDYGDAFRTASVPDTPARIWAKLALASGSELMQRAFSTTVWEGVLGFRLDRGAPETMVGWSIAVDEPELFVLEGDGRLMAGAMVFDIEAGEVTWTTMLRFHHTPARQVWAVAGYGHRAIVPRLLGPAGAAARRNATRRSATLSV